MPAESARVRSMNETRDRILDVALDVLGDNPDAGMGDIAAAAGVVRRTVYGHFPSRLDLIRTLTERAVTEMTAVLAEVSPAGAEADAAWVEFIDRVWPVARRYRVLLALRRGEYGEAIHGLLGPVDELLADLVKRGQDSDVFARHLPAGILSQVAYGVVFAIADSDQSGGTRGARAAAITTLLMLGVPETRAIALAGDQPTLFEFAGGEEAFLPFAAALHARCLADPELNHPFSHPDQNPQHVERLAAYLAEVLGGPPRYSTEWGGDQTALVALHSGNGDMSDLGRRFADCFMLAADDAGWPDEPTFRAALRAYISRAVDDVALSHPRDSDIPPGLPIPHWSWGDAG